MADIAGLDIKIGANVSGAIAGLDNVEKKASVTGNAISAVMTKATGTLDKIPVAAGKAAAGFDQIPQAATKAAASVEQIGTAINDISSASVNQFGTVVNGFETIEASIDAISGEFHAKWDPIVAKIAATTIPIETAGAAFTNLKANISSFGGGVLTFNTQGVREAIADVSKLTVSVKDVPPLNIPLANSPQILKTVEDVELLLTDLTRLGSGGSASVSQLTQALNILKSASTNAVDPKAIIIYDAAIAKVTAELTRLKAASQTGGVAITGVGKGSNTAAFALQNLGRVAQDLPFGFIGIQNNLNPLFESFQQLRKETGSSVLAFKALGSSLFGAGGLGIALSIVSAAITIATVGMGAWTRSFGGAKKAVDEAKEANEDYIKSLKDINQEAVKGAEKEITSLTKFVAIAQSSNASYKQRLDAVVKLQEISPAYFGNLTKEQILYGDLTDAIDQTTIALFNKFNAEAAEQKASAASAKRYNIVLATRDVTRELLKAQTDLDRVLKNPATPGFTITSYRAKVNDAEKALKDLRTQLFEADLEQATFIADATKYSILAGAIDKTGDKAKAIEGIFRDLGITIGEINRKEIVSGISLNKEKIDADKKAIEDLLKTSIDLKDVRLTNLIDEFKALGGTFDDAGSKSEKALDRIKKVLSDLAISRAELNRDPLIKVDDKPEKEIGLIQSAIKELSKLKANPQIIVSLRTEIGEDQGFLDDPTLLQKVITKDINEFGKKLKPEAIPVPVQITIPSIDVVTSLKDIEDAIALNKKIAALKESGIKLFTSQGIQAASTDFLNAKEINTNFDSLQNKIQGTAALVDSVLTPAFAAAFDTIGKGQNVFQAVGQAIGQLIKKMIAAALEAAVLSLIINAIFPGAGSAFNFKNLFSQLSGIPKFAGGGIATTPTFGIFGEAGKGEALIPLERLNDFLKPANEFPDFLPAHRVSGDELLLWYKRAVAHNGRTF